MAEHDQLRGRVRGRQARPPRVRRDGRHMRRRAVALAAFAAAAAGGAALGWAGERRMLKHETPVAEPDWRELRKPIRGRARTVESFDGTNLYVDIVGDDSLPTIVFAHGYALG